MSEEPPLREPSKKNVDEKSDGDHWPLLGGSLKHVLFGQCSPPPIGPPPVKPFKTMAEKLKNDSLMNCGSANVELKSEDSSAALLEECLKEDFALLQVGSENFNEKLTHYRRPEFVNTFLKKHDIRPLKKKSEKFPKALYYCRLCDYHCDRLFICMQHVESMRHTRLSKMQEVEITLFHLPKPTRHHLETLEQLLLKIDKELSLSPADMQARSAVAMQVQTILRACIPECSIRLYGSSLSGFGLKDSDINLDLQIPESLRPDKALLLAFDAILNSHEFKRVERDFCSKIPSVTFYVDNIKCEVSLNNHMAYQTSLLLRDYFFLDPRLKTLSSALRLWARLCMIDCQAEGTLPSHAFALLLVYFLQQGKNPVLPCLHDFLESKDLDFYETPKASLADVKLHNSCSVSELWIEFFEFYALGFNVNEDIVSIRNVGGFSREEKQWKGKKLAIEDPFSTKRSLTRSVNNPHNLDFITDCIKIAYLYFGTVQTTQGPTVTKIVVPDSPRPRGTESEIESSHDSCSQLIPNVFTRISEEITAYSSHPPLPPKILTVQELEKKLIGESSSTSLTSFETFRKQHGTVLTPKQAQQVAEIVPKNMILFKFDREIFTEGQRPILLCSVCGNEGHLQSTCPEENLPPLKPLPEMSQDQKSILNRICTEVMLELQPKLPELRARDFILFDMMRYIKKTFPTASLTLYGSSCNGFAIAHSDLDISLTFTDHPTVETVNAIDVIEKLAEKLKRMHGIGNIQAITSAKVPIIKFVHYDTRIEGDISLYNILAQENTRLLKEYASIDQRVKILGYMVKFFAKKCDIGDASRGSLSSYAYILMLIFYLQQCQPPVLPVLQELYSGDEKPQNMVSGWNAWFFSDLKALPDIWKEWGKNRMSIADLWIGFLEFYSSGFNDRSYVVSIRQKNPLTKFEKMWNSPCIAIEDPFELEHNLGAGLSRKMNLFIKKAFMKSRDHFGTPMPLCMSMTELKDHYFDAEAMSEGQPPNDRGCRACGKIGHLVRDCPRKKNSDERKKREKRERAEAKNRKSDNGKSTESKNKEQKIFLPNDPEIPHREAPSKEVLLEDPIERRTMNRTVNLKANIPLEEEPKIDSHFMNLIAGIGVVPQKSSEYDRRHGSQFHSCDPPPLPPTAKVLTVEELEKTFEAKQNVEPSRTLHPPPGFPVTRPIGMPSDSPLAVGQSPNQLFLRPAISSDHTAMSAPDLQFQLWNDHLMKNLPRPETESNLEFRNPTIVPPRIPPIASLLPGQPVNQALLPNSCSQFSNLHPQPFMPRGGAPVGSAFRPFHSVPPHFPPRVFNPWAPLEQNAPPVDLQANNISSRGIASAFALPSLPFGIRPPLSTPLPTESIGHFEGNNVNGYLHPQESFNESIGRPLPTASALPIYSIDEELKNRNFPGWS